MVGRLTLMALVMATLPSCSSSDDGGAATREGDIHANEVWKNGLKLTGLVRIFEGATVDIEPGARITCVNRAQIQVGGTLRVASTGKHATIACSHWGGVLVAGNGQLDATGLDLDGAEVGVETTPKAGHASLTDSSITNSTRPFLVRADSTLELTKVKITTPTALADGTASVSEVFGSLTAKYVEYQANNNEGIMVERDGEADIQDSTMQANHGNDLISSYGGKSLKVSYTTMKGGHCGLHVAVSKDPDQKRTGSITIDHVTSEDSYGITIYGASLEGPHMVKDSNFIGTSSWIDLQGDHGPITFQDIFTQGGQQILCALVGQAPQPCPQADTPTFDLAPARIANAQPR